MKIVEKPIFIILLFSSFPIFAVEAKKEIPEILFHEYNQIAFDSLPEMSIEKFDSIRNILEISPEYAYTFETVLHPEYSEWLPMKYKLLDFTNDGNNDLIYNGAGAGEERLCILWENCIDKFKIGAVLGGDIAKILVDSTNGANYTFVVVFGLCCDSELGSIKVLSPGFKGNRLKYIESKIYEFFKWTDFPDNYERIPQKNFHVKSDSTCLRMSPEVNNKYNGPYDDFDNKPLYGNIIAKLAKGGTGTVYAKFQDKSQNLWWFVTMDANAKFVYDYQSRDSSACKCGWIESIFLEIIE